MTNHPPIWPPLWQRMIAAILSIAAIAIVIAAFTLLFMTRPVLTVMCLLIGGVLFGLLGKFMPAAPVERV